MTRKLQEAHCAPIALQSCRTQVSYNHDVRRLLAISLLLLFSLPLLSPLLALPVNRGDNLPACCRRNGMHHCALMMSDGQSEGTQFSTLRAKCPAYPKAITLTRRNDLSLGSATPLFTEVVVHASGRALAATNAQIAAHRSQYLRGPPSLM